MKYHDAFLYLCDCISKDHHTIAKIILNMKDNQSIIVANYKITLNYSKIYHKKTLYMVSLYNKEKLKMKTLLDIGKSIS